MVEIWLLFSRAHGCRHTSSQGNLQGDKHPRQPRGEAPDRLAAQLRQKGAAQQAEGQGNERIQRQIILPGDIRPEPKENERIAAGRRKVTTMRLRRTTSALRR